MDRVPIGEIFFISEICKKWLTNSNFVLKNLLGEGGGVNFLDERLPCNLDNGPAGRLYGRCQ